MTDSTPAAANVDQNDQARRIIEELAGMDPLDSPTIHTCSGKIIAVDRVTSFNQGTRIFCFVPQGSDKAQSIHLDHIKDVTATATGS